MAARTVSRTRVLVGKVFVDITTSLDGFVAAPNVGMDNPMGDGGGVLHTWVGVTDVQPDERDRAAASAMFANTGAFVMGRRTFDLGIGQWGPSGTFGMPCFVVTHRDAARLVKGATSFEFVTGGVAGAIERAASTAGDQDVCVMGGAAVAQQCIEAGLVDQLNLHLAPVLLGAGTRLFDHSRGLAIGLRLMSAIQSAHAAHLRYRVARRGTA